MNGETNPPSDDLKRLFRIHGGSCELYRGMETITHFVCNTFTNQQQREENDRKVVEKRQTYEKVTQEWILESIKAKKRLPEDDFNPFKRRGGDVRKLFSNQNQKSGTGRSNSNSNSSNISNASAEHEGPTPTKSAGRGSHNVQKYPSEFLEQYLGKSRLHFIGTWRDRAFEVYNELVRRRKMCGFASLAIPSQESNSNGNSEPSWLPKNKNRNKDKDAHLNRVVLHADLDCFFVSAIVRDNPKKQERIYPDTHELKSEEYVIPIAVAHTADGVVTSNAEISSCNYSARRKGVRNGMHMASAKDRCPELEVLQYDFPLYERVSKQLYEILLSFGGEENDAGCMISTCVLCELISVDEAYLELPPGSDGIQAAQHLRQLVLEKTGCPLSIGVGSSKLLARLATKEAKPPGPGYYMFRGDHSNSSNSSSSLGRRDEVHFSGSSFGTADEIVTNVRSSSSSGQIINSIAEQVSRLEMRDIPSVGRKCAEALKEKGFVLCADVQKLTLIEFQRKFQGDSSIEKDKSSPNALSEKFLNTLYELSHGIDERPLVPPRPQKSMGVDVTWGIRFSTQDSVDKFVEALGLELDKRLRTTGVTSVGIVTMKIMKRHPDAGSRPGKSMGHGKCLAFSKSKSFKANPIKLPFANQITESLLTLYYDVIKANDISVDELRGIGAQCGELNTDDEAILLRDHSTLLSNSYFSGNKFVESLLGEGSGGSKAEAIRGVKQLNQYFQSHSPNKVKNDNNDQDTLSRVSISNKSISINSPSSNSSGNSKESSVNVVNVVAVSSVVKKEIRDSGLQNKHHSPVSSFSTRSDGFKTSASQEELLGAFSEQTDKNHMLGIWKAEFYKQESLLEQNRIEKAKVSRPRAVVSSYRMQNKSTTGNKRAAQPRIDALLVMQRTGGNVPIELISEDMHVQRMNWSRDQNSSSSKTKTTSNLFGTGNDVATGKRNRGESSSRQQYRQEVYFIESNNDSDKDGDSEEEEEGLKRPKNNNNIKPNPNTRKAPNNSNNSSRSIPPINIDSLVSSQDFVAPDQDGKGRFAHEHMILEGDMSNDFLSYPPHEWQSEYNNESNENNENNDGDSVDNNDNDINAAAKYQFGGSLFPFHGVKKFQLSVSVQQFVSKIIDSPSEEQVQYIFDYAHWIVHSQRHDLLSVYVRALQSKRLANGEKDTLWNALVRKVVWIIQEQAVLTKGMQIQLDINKLD